MPGTVGGAIRGNAGAFAGEIKDCVKEVVSLNISKKQPKIVKRNNKQCAFGYRNSIFKSGEGKDEFITSVTFSLRHGNREKIQKAIQEKIDYRNNKHPIDYPNI